MRIHTKRRTPTPARIGVASEKSCQINIKGEITIKTYPSPEPETYEANTPFECHREGIKDFHGGFEAACQPFVTTSRPSVHLNLLLKALKHENSIGRVAGLELSGEWMRKKVHHCTLFICLQGTNDCWPEMGGRDGTGVDVRHDVERGEYVRCESARTLKKERNAVVGRRRRRREKFTGRRGVGSPPRIHVLVVLRCPTRTSTAKVY